MKPPPRVEVGRLVALLSGEELTKSSIQDLLRPDSTAKLSGILTYSPPLGRKDHNPGPVQPEEGKVLFFRAKEAIKP